MERRAQTCHDVNFGMSTKCQIDGCEKPPAVGLRLCKNHVDEVDAVWAQARLAAKHPVNSETKNRDPYDILVDDTISKIGMSDQMRNLTFSLMEGGIRDAQKTFPGLKNIPTETIELLASFLAVSVVSAIIQERAHLLARAKMLADSLPAEQASGILMLIDDELNLLT